MEFRSVVSLSGGSSEGIPLICFPGAAGSVHSFAPLARALFGTARVFGACLPGRGSRRQEVLPQSIQALSMAFDDLIPLLKEGPFAMFGHSMGALVAFEVARRYKNHFGVSPALLIVSACKAPSVPSVSSRHRLADAALIEQMVDLGASPEPFEFDEIRAMALPLLRADLELVESYGYQSSGGMLDCDVLAVAAASDPEARPKQMDLWDRQTFGEFERCTIEGNHFFIEHDVARLADTLESRLIPRPSCRRSMYEWPYGGDPLRYSPTSS